MSEDPEPTGASLSYENILRREIENALKEFDRPSRGLFVSGFSAGLNLSFGALFMGMVLTFSPTFPSELVQRSLLALVSSVAFLFVLLGQTELFTAHTTLAVLPVFDRRAGLDDLARLWGVVFGANLAGCAVFAGLVAMLGPSLEIVTASAFDALATSLLDQVWWAMLLSAVLAGWLMGLVVWLVAASRDTVGRIAVILIVTGAITFGPFHHIVLGTTEVLGAMFLGTGVAIPELAGFLVWTTLGNILGGTVFVAGLNYGHIALLGEDTEIEVEQEGEERG